MRLILLAGVLFAVGCAAPEAADDGAESGDEAVVAGSATFDHPEIGMVRHGNSLCTGTLIRPNVVITALHCTPGGKNDADVTDEGYTFVVVKSATEKHTYKVDRMFNTFAAAEDFSSQKWREKDIALLRLTESVPDDVARPAGLARTSPWPGAHVAVYGFGCSSRTPGDDGRRPGTGTKRTRAYRWDLGLFLGFGTTQDLCQGDSGGPLMDLDRGMVFGINSGYIGPDDQYADVPASYDLINVLLVRWRQ